MDDDTMNPWRDWEQRFASAPSAKIPVVFWDEIKPRYDAADFVEGLLTDEGMSVLYGASNSGKTFFAADLALAVASGRQWRGRDVEQRAVIWLAMEGSFGIFNRVEAWRRENGMEDATIPFAVVPVALNLLDPEADTEPLIQLVKNVAATLEMPVGLIVVDTLSRAIAGGNENSPEDMGSLVTNGTRLQQANKSHVLWIHHSGKDEAKGARGHSLLRAATDTEIELTSDGVQRLARVTKQREMDTDGEFPFTLRIVELGKNRRGKPVTSCVVQHDEGGVIIRGTAKLDGHKKRAFDVLVQLVAGSGKTGYPGVPSGCASVPADWWRQQFYENAMPGAEDAAKKKAFQRATSDLLNAKPPLVGMAKGRVWVVSPDIGAASQ